MGALTRPAARPPGYGNVDIPPDEIPTLRTIQRIVQESAKTDSSGPWSLLRADPLEASVLLPAFADILEASRPGTPPLTIAEAKMMARILLSTSGLPGRAARRIAREYLKCESSALPTPILDATLAFAPWHSKEASDRFVRWLNATVPDPSALETALLDQYLVIVLCGLTWSESGRDDDSRVDEPLEVMHEIVKEVFPNDR